LARRTIVLALQVLLVVAVVGCGGSSTAAHSTAAPSPSPTMTTADRATLTTLEARPLKLPALLAGGICAPDGMNASTSLFGADPVYVEGGPHTASSFGDYFDVSAKTKPGLAGPVLVRGQDLKVANHPIVFIGPYGAGAVYGTDPKNGTQYVELALDTAHPPQVTYNINGTAYVEWDWRQGIATGWSGCVGFQIDGPGFTEDINVNQPPP
jgi:hypothetical protein